MLMPKVYIVVVIEDFFYSRLTNIAIISSTPGSVSTASQKNVSEPYSHGNGTTNL